MTEKKGVNPTAIYLAIAVVIVIVGIVAVALLLGGGNLFSSPSAPEPAITDTTVSWDNEGRTYRVYVTVGNNGASGNVKVFCEVKAVESGNVRFSQTQDRTMYLDKGGSTTVTFEFNSPWLAVSEVSKRVWAIVP